MNLLPLRGGEQVAALGRMHAGQVEDFGCVQVADACYGSLVEQGDLDRPAALGQSIAQLACGDGQGVGAEVAVAQSLGELRFRE